MVQKHLLKNLPPELRSRIGYNKHYKKLLSLETLVTLTIIWYCTRGPLAGPDERAIEMLNLKMIRPPWLTASSLGYAARRALRLPGYMQPQFTEEKFIASKRRHVRAGVEFGLLSTKKVEKTACVAVYSTEKLNTMMEEFWKSQTALMFRLTRKLDKQPEKRNQGDKEESGGE
jgi:hypothetical protein